MARIVTVIPQDIDDSTHLTLEDLVNGLPDQIPFTDNIGVTGRIRLGKQVGTVVFVAQTDTEITSEMKLAFSNYVRTITHGRVSATVTNAWRRKELDPRWIYTNGQKIFTVSDGQFTYTAPPVPTSLPVWLPVDVVLDRIKNISWPFAVDCYLTGGMVREGGSYNDIDFVLGELVEVNNQASLRVVAHPELCKEAKTFLVEHIRADVGVNEIYSLKAFHIDVGSTIMTNKGKVYFCKVFDGQGGVYCGPGR